MTMPDDASSPRPLSRPGRRALAGVAVAGLLTIGCLILLVRFFPQEPSVPAEKPASTPAAADAGTYEMLPATSSTAASSHDSVGRVRRLEDLPHAKRSVAESLVTGGDDILAQLKVAPEKAPEAVHSLLDHYRLAMKPKNGLPTGNHQEIVDVLLGDNAWGVPLFSPDHPALDREGQLTDPWRSPFFFHVESAENISVRSAGPDRTMWTRDDLVYPPPIESPEGIER